MAYLAPVEVTAPVAGTTAGVWKFARPVRAISVDNQSGEDAYVRCDGATASTASGAYVLRLGDGTGTIFTEHDLGQIGLLQNISIWFVSGATVASCTITGVEE